MTARLVETALSNKVETARAAPGAASLAGLIGAKIRFLLPMVATYMVGFIGLTVLAGFAKGFVAQKLVGSLNVGFFLICCNYVLAWILALVYVRVANNAFDSMVADVVGAGRRPGAQP